MLNIFQELICRCMFPSIKCLFICFALLEVFLVLFFLLLNFESSLKLYSQVLCHICNLQKHFCQSGACLFILLIGPLHSKSFLIWHSLIYRFFLLWLMSLVSSVRIICLAPDFKHFLKLIFEKLLLLTYYV